MDNCSSMFALTWLHANLIRRASWDWLNERRASQKFRMWVSSSVRPAWGSFTENLSTWDLGALQPVYLWHVILVAWYMVWHWYMVHGAWCMVHGGTWYMVWHWRKATSTFESPHTSSSSWKSNFHSPSLTLALIQAMNKTSRLTNTDGHLSGREEVAQDWERNQACQASKYFFHLNFPVIWVW